MALKCIKRQNKPTKVFSFVLIYDTTASDIYRQRYEMLQKSLRKFNFISYFKNQLLCDKIRK